MKTQSTKRYFCEICYNSYFEEKDALACEAGPILGEKPTCTPYGHVYIHERNGQHLRRVQVASIGVHNPLDRVGLHLWYVEIFQSVVGGGNNGTMCGTRIDPHVIAPDVADVVVKHVITGPDA